MGTDCAITWSLEPDDNTPATLQGSIASSITSSTASHRVFTATSTDWIDVGTYTFTLSCYFVNYPTSGAVVNTITVTVKDCDGSANNCECGWLEYSSDVTGWGSYEWTKPASMSSDLTVFSAVSL